MNVKSNASLEMLTTPTSTGVPSAIAARRRRRMLVYSLRILFLVVIIGGWELATRVGIVDKFFWGQPSGTWAQTLSGGRCALAGARGGKFGELPGIASFPFSSSAAAGGTRKLPE